MEEDKKRLTGEGLVRKLLLLSFLLLNLSGLKIINFIISICLDEYANIKLKGFASVFVFSVTVFTLELESCQQKVNSTVVYYAVWVALSVVLSFFNWNYFYDAAVNRTGIDRLFPLC